MNLLKKIFKRKPFKFNNEYIINPAFEVGGVQYYQFDDAFNIPYERALHALTYYEELRMRCTREFLLDHTKAVAAILNDPKKISVGELALLNLQLKERLEWIIEPDIAYKLASVVFFDKTENPAVYEFKYAAKKIKLWKEHKGLNDFFLQKPVQTLIPFLTNSEVNLEIYSELLEKMKKIHSDTISTILSGQPKKEGSGKNTV